MRLRLLSWLFGWFAVGLIVRPYGGLERQARNGPQFFTATSAPFFAYSRNDIGHDALDIGYSWWGRYAIIGRHTRLGNSWSLSLAPLPAVFLAYTGGDHAQPATV